MTINGWTIALQAINFLVLVWLLWRLLYKPVQAVMARRKTLVEQAFRKAEDAQKAAQDEQRKYQAGQAELVQSRQELLSRAHEEIAADRAKLLEDANAQVDAMLKSAREQIEAERKTALSETKTQVADLAVDMASALLRRVALQAETAKRLNDAFLAQVTARLDELSPEQRQSLRQELAAESEGLRIVTGVPLNAEEQGRWQRALQDRIGPARSLEFLVEPALIGGAELRFSHAVLSLAWSELLRQGRNALLVDDDAR